MASVKLLYILFMILTIIVIASSLDCSKVQCLQGFKPLDCPEKTIYSDRAAFGGCCPGCVTLSGPNEECNGDAVDITYNINQYFVSKKSTLSTIAPPIVSSKKCAPGLKCENNRCTAVFTCAPDPSNDKWSPACDVDGSWKAVQCKENGAEPRCFCYSKTGTRIFGFDWIENRDKMHCLCSRMVEAIKDDQNYVDISLHCTQNGNFEPLQCSRGFCYCVDIYTGQPLSSSVPSASWKLLPCYNRTTMGDEYLKLCDSQSNAKGVILKELGEHGNEPVSLTSAKCDPDGSYFPKSCSGSECYCVTKDNAKISSYFTALDQSQRQTCNCARDKVIFQEAHRVHNYRCDNGGNYIPLQSIDGQYFCVDSDGFLTKGPSPDNTLQC